MRYIKSLLLRLALPFLIKYYRVNVARTLEEKQKVFKFRYDIYRVELAYEFLDTRSKDGMFYDDYDFMDNTLILYSGDIDHITSTVRLTVWDKEHLPKKILENFNLKESMVDKINRLGEYHFFQVRKDYRRSLLAIVLLIYTCKAVIDQPQLTPDLIFFNCQPGLIKYYLAMGAYPYTHEVIHREYGLLQIPLAMPSFDLTNLKKNHCLSYHCVKYYAKKLKKNAPFAIYQSATRNAANVLHPISLYLTPAETKKFGEMISKKNHRERYAFIVSLMKNIVLLSVEKNTPILRKNLVDFDMYLIVEGSMGIFLNERVIAKLIPGDIFGEMALLAEHHRRYTEVTALTDSKIILIPRNFIKELQTKNLALANEFLHLLCNSLIDKLEASNRLLAKFNHQ
ncbi:MAG: cyclic nucleotide-binding domain-containing protein [Gammaproteobacteria bacterium]|nr:cyclic nucleotide-binding domain-containing protein [Gammaproteobacteria bacterium]